MILWCRFKKAAPNGLSFMKKVFITIDVEQDCPPYLSTVEGMKQGMPKLLDLFASEKISATFFTTGKMAELFPEIMRRIVDEGHELGCHGYTHRRFDQMSYEEAEYEIKMSAQVLRQYGPVVSFRAPNLSFPDAYLPILVDNGFEIDSSLAKYKMSRRYKMKTIPGLQRIIVTFCCICFRLPFFLTRFRIKNIENLVLYMHPWEFIDMSKTGIRFDCHINTGDQALKGLKKWILFLKIKNYQFVTIQTSAINS
ncbi:MAG: polysaccharide deacetylase family protein, partial [Gammaproteobacteria bacterium]|nr:polysaccharide deacetylase family protein [Gammaproteobacteria bacterium]